MQKQITCLSFFLLLNIFGYMLKVDLSSRYVGERGRDKTEAQRSPVISFGISILSGSLVTWLGGAKDSLQMSKE